MSGTDYKDDNWLDESIRSYLNKIEDVGWSRIDQLNTFTDEEGPALDDLKGASQRLREAAATQPLPQRGSQLRHAYVFGRGMLFTNADQPRVRRVIDDPHNKSVLFSVEAYEQANSSKFTDGLFCVVYDKKRRRFTQLPLDRITGVQCDPNDPMDILAVQTTWNQRTQAWIMVSRNEGEKRLLDLQSNEHIVRDTVCYVTHTKRQSGWTFGVPDSLAGHIFMLTYNAYLRDNAELVHALSKIAWKITTPNKSATEKAAGVVENGGGGVGGTFASSGDLSGVGVPSAQVDFNKGQPLAALVATSYSVPVIALLSSPGATGGSYGAATTLDAPTLKGFEAVQDSWKLFYEEILRDLGAKDVSVSFPTISNDPEYRQVSSVAQSVELGIVHKDEARDLVIDILNIVPKHKGLPKLPKPETNTGSDTVVPQQGKPAKGAAGTPDNPTNHDNDDTK